MSDDWFNADDLQAQIDKESEQRRKDPLAFVLTLFRELWVDNTPEEFRAAWRSKVKLAPWYAQDALYCLKAVLANPPANLVERLRDKGGVYLFHPGSAAPYTVEETLHWLAQVTQDFQADYDHRA